MAEPKRRRRAARPSDGQEGKPCVVCGHRPSRAFSYAPAPRHGRVCGSHADQLAAVGAGVAFDDGRVENW